MSDTWSHWEDVGRIGPWAPRQYDPYFARYWGDWKGGWGEPKTAPAHQPYATQPTAQPLYPMAAEPQMPVYGDFTRKLLEEQRMRGMMQDAGVGQDVLAELLKRILGMYGR